MDHVNNLSKGIDMKKIMLFCLLAVSSTAMACDGSCRCGGLPIQSSREVTIENIKAVTQWSCYLAGGYFLAVKAGIAWPIGIPALCIYLSREQRAYNLANGITHSRENRRR